MEAVNRLKACNLRVGENLKYLGVDEGIILKWILNRLDRRGLS
jgi:hypothetical protein